MKEFIKSNQCLLYHVIIWSILIFIAMIEHRDYTFLIIMALFSLLNIYKTSKVNWFERFFRKTYAFNNTHNNLGNNSNTP